MDRQALVIHLVALGRWGAVGKYALDICRHYHASGVETMAVTKGALAVDSHFREAGIKVEQAPLTGVLSMATAMRIMNILRGYMDSQVVIHAHRYRDAMIAGIAAKFSKHKDVKIVVTRHRLKEGSDSILYKMLYNRIDSHIFVSDLAKEVFLRTWRNRKLPVEPDKIHVLHNSVNVAEPSCMEEPVKGPVTAMFHGNVARGKGVETIIDALSLINGVKIRLKIVGKGNPDYIDTLRRRAMNRGVMELIDWKKTDDPMPYLGQCHYGVLPSIEREACGMSNIECMACGRAQICTFNGAQPEYLTDGVEALAVAPADPSALAQKMEILAKDPDFRHEMGRAAYNRYSGNLSWSNFIDAIDKIYGFKYKK